MEWQPIETAPEEEWVIVTGGQVDEGHFDDFSPIPSAVVAILAEPWHNGNPWWIVSPYDSAAVMLTYSNPTHWMPLPTSPERANG